MQRYSDWFPIIISYRSNMSAEIPKTTFNELPLHPSSSLVIHGKDQLLSERALRKD